MLEDSKNSRMITWEMPPTEYLSLYARRYSYLTRRTGLRKYLSVYLKRRILDIDGAMHEYLAARDSSQVVKDLMMYYQNPEIQALAPITRRNYLTAIEGFLSDCCGIELAPLQKRLRRRTYVEKAVAITADVSPTREMIAALLGVADIRQQVEVILASAGGLRLGEILALRVEDVRLDEHPCRIIIRGDTTKNGLPRHTFLTTEGADIIRSYLKVRDKHVATQLSNSRKRVNPVDPEALIPQSASNETQFLEAMLDAAGYGERDPRTNIRILHFHSLRKFFLTQAKKSARPEFVEHWAGHSGYLTSAYHRPSLEEEQAEYLKCEMELTIRVPDDYMRLKLEHQTEMEQLRDIYLAQQELLSRLQDELRALKHEKQNQNRSAIPDSLD